MFNNFICIMSAHLLSHNTIKSIMHMPSISTLKSYMNVNEAKTGWHDEIGEQNPSTPFPKKESNPDGTIVRSKYSVSVSDSEEVLETKQINKPGSITQIIPFDE
ncbi:20347_t:CDS:2, partial [Entrophospora sp. SA101]